MSLHSRVTIDVDVTPRFTACYLRLAGGECAFVEAHTAHALPRLLAELERCGRRPEDVRWIIVTHAHLDHAAGAGLLLEQCPRATLLAHPRAAKNLVDPTRLVEGAVAVYGEERFRKLYGAVKPVPAGRVRALADGESFELGGGTLTAWHTAGHAFHHLVVDDPATESVYTGDAFGLVYPALQRLGRFALPSTSPTGFHAAEALRSIDRILSLGERFVCLTHFGAFEDAPAIAEQLRRFVARADAWVQRAAGGDEPAAALQRRLTRAWWAAITEEAPGLGHADLALLTLDVELNAQGLAHAAMGLRAGPSAPT